MFAAPSIQRKSGNGNPVIGYSFPDFPCRSGNREGTTTPLRFKDLHLDWVRFFKNARLSNATL